MEIPLGRNNKTPYFIGLNIHFFRRLKGTDLMGREPESLATHDEYCYQYCRGNGYKDTFLTSDIAQLQKQCFGKKLADYERMIWKQPHGEAQYSHSLDYDIQLKIFHGQRLHKLKEKKEKIEKQVHLTVDQFMRSYENKAGIKPPKPKKKKLTRSQRQISASKAMKRVWTHRKLNKIFDIK